jgi:hypothetical protein
MKSKWVWALLVAVLGAVLYGGTVQATPPSGVTITPLAPVAQFGEINAKAKIDDWKAKLKTKGVSDVHVVQVTIQPGGTLGWHQHPGAELRHRQVGHCDLLRGRRPHLHAPRDPDRLEPLRTSRRRAHRPKRRHRALGQCRGTGRSDRRTKTDQRAEPGQLPLLRVERKGEGWVAPTPSLRRPRPE